MSIEERFRGANIIEAGSLSPYWGEHVARYRFALPFVKGCHVLDVACGTGYGLAFLKESASSVTGVDVDLEAAIEAKHAFNGQGSRVLLGDGTRLPFGDETFDAITSFETLEHIHQRTKFLSELRRVLRVGGTMVLSTPNANYTKPVNGKPTNPFHIYEYKPEELKQELENQFEVKEYLGQRLDPEIRIPPFEDAQKRLPVDLATRSMLFGWKIINKMPLRLRDGISGAIWSKPFYPTENDYEFSAETIAEAPVLTAVLKRGS